MKTIDCRGLACPKPVIMTKKELEAIIEGEIDVIVDNEAAKENVSKLAQNEGLKFEVTESEGFYHVTITKNGSCSCIEKLYDNNKIVIVVGTDKLGNGDEKLGTALMKSYMYALTEDDNEIDSMLFLNSGVKLTVEGSDVLESLKIIEDKGTEILSCGTCLDFYGLKDKLKIGSVTNMYTIVNRMNSADNTIKL